MAKGKKLAFDKDEQKAAQPKVAIPPQPKKEMPKGDIQKHPKFDKFKKGAH